MDKILIPPTREIGYVLWWHENIERLRVAVAIILTTLICAFICHEPLALIAMLFAIPNIVYIIQSAQATTEEITKEVDEKLEKEYFIYLAYVYERINSSDDEGDDND